ncbi:MAG: zinc ABC transporter substrate-binding protein [Chloroflexota bacterium]
MISTTGRRLFYSILLTLLVAGCQPLDTAAGGRLPVVATHSILADLVQNVGGDRVQVQMLVQPGGDAHTFEPNPADGVALVTARLIFENGLGFEPWLDDLYAASGATAQRVVVTEGIELLPAAEETEEEHEGDGEEHEHGEWDPHVWQSVPNVMRMVQAIEAALAAADPPNADSYQSNAVAYLEQLQELDHWIFEQVNQLPAARRQLVTSHDTFAYFAQRYSFTITGTAFGSISTEAADPPAAHVAELVQAIQAAGVPAIFAENVANPGLMEQLAAEAGVRLAPPLYTDALGEPGSQGENYLALMRYNVTTIVTALVDGS